MFRCLTLPRCQGGIEPSRRCSGDRRPSHLTIGFCYRPKTALFDPKTLFPQCHRFVTALWGQKVLKRLGKAKPARGFILTSKILSKVGNPTLLHTKVGFLVQASNCLRCENISCCTSVAAVQPPIVRRTGGFLKKRMTTIYPVQVAAAISRQKAVGLQGLSRSRCPSRLPSAAVSRLAAWISSNFATGVLSCGSLPGSSAGTGAESQGSGPRRRGAACDWSASGL